MQVKILKTLILDGLSPFSTNNLWYTVNLDWPQRKIKTYKYSDWRILLEKKLPIGFLPSNMKNYGLGIEVGIRE